MPRMREQDGNTTRAGYAGLGLSRLQAAPVPGREWQCSDAIPAPGESDWSGGADPMAVKAVVVDGTNTHHLIIGISRETLDTLLSGEVFVLPPGNLSGLNESSDVVLLFAETDKELESRFPPHLRPDKPHATKRT